MTFILLVEDNQDNADLVIRILQSAGYEIKHCLRGLEASPSTRVRRPDLILLDFNLPDIDGRVLILTLKRQLGGPKAPPIVALTARTGHIEEVIATRFGCDAFMHKPFDPEELLSLVSQLAPLAVQQNQERDK